eukprot:TRINITY_DN77154_c0_g1_i1.p1 TRINITY_DN77154_c0_g1~~TRINITY_DN77154_c0_g1_i1.p1  ORF type:complete len:363 (-),score=58.55 TRINITY_DN77154_c0_g1_i1:188-1276(-)
MHQRLRGLGCVIVLLGTPALLGSGRSAGHDAAAVIGLLASLTPAHLRKRSRTCLRAKGPKLVSAPPPWKQAAGPSVSPEILELLAQLQRTEPGSDDARQVAEQLLERPERLTRLREYGLMMHALVEKELWQEALGLLDNRQTKMPSDRARLVGVNCAMEAFGSKHGERWPMVLSILDGMWGDDLVPDIISYNTAMRNCRSAGEWQQVLLLLEEMNRFKRKDFDVYRSSIVACAQGRLWGKALTLLNEMFDSELNPSWSQYNLCIILAEEGRCWEYAIHLLDTMWMKEVVPESSTYISVIGVCEQSGRWHEALQLLRVMRRKGFACDAGAYSSVRQSCLSSGQEEAAQDLAEEMAILGLPMDT